MSGRHFIFTIGVLFAARAANASALTDLQNASSGFNQAVGGIGWCGDISAAELKQVSCVTQSKLTASANLQQATSLTENLILNDMAGDAQDSVDCYLPMLDAYRKSARTAPPTGMALAMNQAAYAKFLTIQPALTSATDKFHALQAQEQSELQGCNIDHADFACTAPIRKKYQDQISQIYAGITALTATVPMAQSESVRDALVTLASEGRTDFASFNSLFSPAVMGLEHDMRSFQTELNAHKVKSARGVYYDFSGMPSAREHFMSSDQYDQRLKTTGVSSDVFKKMMCRRDAEFKDGPRRINAAVTVVSVLAFAASFGSSVAVEGGAGGLLAVSDEAAANLQSASLALQVGSTTTALAPISQALLTCADQPTIIAKAPAHCSVDQAYTGVLARANASACISAQAMAFLEVLAPLKAAVKMALRPGALTEASMTAEATAALEERAMQALGRQELTDSERTAIRTAHNICGEGPGPSGIFSRECKLRKALACRRVMGRADCQTLLDQKILGNFPPSTSAIDHELDEVAALDHWSQDFHTTRNLRLEDRDTIQREIEQAMEDLAQGRSAKKSIDAIKAIRAQTGLRSTTAPLAQPPSPTAPVGITRFVDQSALSELRADTPFTEYASPGIQRVVMKPEIIDFLKERNDRGLKYLRAIQKGFTAQKGLSGVVRYNNVAKNFVEVKVLSQGYKHRLFGCIRNGTLELITVFEKHGTDSAGASMGKYAHLCD